jgi:hypothetical protein
MTHFLTEAAGWQVVVAGLILGLVLGLIIGLGFRAEEDES